MNKKKIILSILGIAAAITSVYIDKELSKARDLQSQVRKLKIELAHAMIYAPMERDTVIVHDTVEVTTVTSDVIMAELSDLREQHIIDEQLIRELGLKVKYLESVQTAVTETKDTAKAEYNDSKKVYSYSDRWSSLKFSLEDSTFYYNIRDSLATIVTRIPKRKFLWWAWGTKGYKVKVVNFNPHSTVIYNTMVMPE